MGPDSNDRRADSGQRRAGSVPDTAFAPRILPGDLRLIRRFSLGLGFHFLFVFAFSRLELLYGEKFFDVSNTGNGEWIWMPLRMADGTPAAFYATRDFDLPSSRQFTRIKILGDPEYTLYFNGREIGGRRVGEESALDVYDVSNLARDRGNRLVVALRSANGVGALIVSVDLTQEFRNYVVTDRGWHIVPEWRPDILDRDRAPFTKPLLLGRPPARRWNYLSRRPGNPFAPRKDTLAPQESFSFKTRLADIQVKDGVPVTVAIPVAATAYDFGVGATGRLQLTAPPSATSRVVRVRFTTERSELFDVEGGVETFTFAPGETTVVDPETRIFRYAEVYDRAAASLVR
jgi:hypothetical protein